MKPIFILLTFLLPSTVFASTVVAVDEATLVAKADTIAVVSVLTSAPFRGDGGTRTRYVLQVHEGLRNAREGQVIEMDVPGGTLGGIHSEVSGSPQLQAGAMVVVFLESHGTSRRPLGLSYGVFQVGSDSQGAWNVGRSVSGLSLLDHHGRMLDAQTTASVAEGREAYGTFVTRIKRHVAALGRVAQP